MPDRAWWLLLGFQLGFWICIAMTSLMRHFVA